MFDSLDIWFLILLPVIAFLYASVGHGGASGYLALMALFGFSSMVMKPTALTLNLFVAAISFYHFRRSGHFKWNLFWPFALSSVPMAFLGGIIELEQSHYKRILGILLIFAILKMLNVFNKASKEKKELLIWQGLLAGAVIGLFSGMIGIGGGIILSPVILIMAWGNMKEAAAVSALFIWVNSAAGLAGHYSQEFSMPEQAPLFVALAIIGGFAGGYLGSQKLKSLHLRYLLAFVLVIASVKLLFI